MKTKKKKAAAKKKKPSKKPSPKKKPEQAALMASQPSSEDSRPVPRPAPVLKPGQWMQGMAWFTREEGVVTIGVTDLGLEVIGEPQRVDHSVEEGAQIESEEVLAVIEGSQASIDLEAPLSGSVIEWNPELLEDPTLISEDPAGGGWILRLEADEESEE